MTSLVKVDGSSYLEQERKRSAKHFPDRRQRGWNTRASLSSRRSRTSLPQHPEWKGFRLRLPYENLLKMNPTTPLFSIFSMNVSVAGPSGVPWVRNLILRASTFYLAEADAKDCLTRPRRALYLVPRRHRPSFAGDTSWSDCEGRTSAICRVVCLWETDRDASTRHLFPRDE